MLVLSQFGRLQISASLFFPPVRPTAELVPVPWQQWPARSLYLALDLCQRPLSRWLNNGRHRETDSCLWMTFTTWPRWRDPDTAAHNQIKVHLTVVRFFYFFQSVIKQMFRAAAWISFHQWLRDTTSKFNLTQQTGSSGSLSRKKQLWFVIKAKSRSL